MSGFANRIRSATQDFTARSSVESSALEGAPDVLWSAKGQPLTGIGGGRYRLTATTLFFERGTLTTNAQQVPTNQLFDIDLRQTLTQKTRGVGDVVVHVQRAAGVEQVILNDVPNPREAVNIINEVSNQARINAHTMANTRHFTSNPAPAMPVAPPEAMPPATNQPDAIEQLTKLGQLRDAGILTDDEFAQKKADILARM
ncbi:SHOCT domain-containing protein [Oerskovia sp. NPDC057915]|uniref:SHOCT domain-containing protein n=1 Tax=Oerskovia sp. NPDC057915 TaxID=3346280 RepID=UPI0036DC96C0